MIQPAPGRGPSPADRLSEGRDGRILPRDRPQDATSIRPARRALGRSPVSRAKSGDDLSLTPGRSSKDGGDDGSSKRLGRTRERRAAAECSSGRSDAEPLQVVQSGDDLLRRLALPAAPIRPADHGVSSAVRGPRRRRSPRPETRARRRERSRRTPIRRAGAGRRRGRGRSARPGLGGDPGQDRLDRLRLRVEGRRAGRSAPGRRSPSPARSALLVAGSAGGAEAHRPGPAKAGRNRGAGGSARGSTSRSGPQARDRLRLIDLRGGMNRPALVIAPIAAVSAGAGAAVLGAPTAGEEQTGHDPRQPDTTHVQSGPPVHDPTSSEGGSSTTAYRRARPPTRTIPAAHLPPPDGGEQAASSHERTRPEPSGTTQAGIRRPGQ